MYPFCWKDLKDNFHPFCVYILLCAPAVSESWSLATAPAPSSSPALRILKGRNTISNIYEYLVHVNPSPYKLTNRLFFLILTGRPYADKKLKNAMYIMCSLSLGSKLFLVKNYCIGMIPPDPRCSKISRLFRRKGNSSKQRFFCILLIFIFVYYSQPLHRVWLSVLNKLSFWPRSSRIIYLLLGSNYERHSKSFCYVYGNNVGRGGGQWGKKYLALWFKKRNYIKNVKKKKKKNMLTYLCVLCPSKYPFKKFATNCQVYLEALFFCNFEILLQITKKKESFDIHFMKN